MKITIRSSEETTQLNGHDVRLWYGETEGGVPILAFVSAISCPDAAHVAAFETEKTRGHTDPPEGAPTVFDLEHGAMMR